MEVLYHGFAFFPEFSGYFVKIHGIESIQIAFCRGLGGNALLFCLPVWFLGRYPYRYRWFPYGIFRTGKRPVNFSGG